METLELIRDANVSGSGNVSYEDFVESVFRSAPELYELTVNLNLEISHSSERKKRTWNETSPTAFNSVHTLHKQSAESMSLKLLHIYTLMTELSHRTQIK